VCVELNQVDRSAVFFGESAEDGEADGVITANAGGAGSAGEDRSDSLLDTTERVFDGKRIDGEIPEVGDAIFFERIEFQHGIPRANDGGLHANVARAETGAGSIGGAAVERHADDGDVELFRLRDVREAHEGGDAGEAGVLERVNGLRMREAESTGGFLFSHERGILGAGLGEVNVTTRNDT